MLEKKHCFPGGGNHLKKHGLSRVYLNFVYLGYILSRILRSISWLSWIYTTYMCFRSPSRAIFWLSVQWIFATTGTFFAMSDNFLRSSRKVIFISDNRLKYSYNSVNNRNKSVHSEIDERYFKNSDFPFLGYDKIRATIEATTGSRSMA